MQFEDLCFQKKKILPIKIMYYTDKVYIYYSYMTWVSYSFLCSADQEEVAEGARPLMPPTNEELEAIENEGSKKRNKDSTEPRDTL